MVAVTDGMDDDNLFSLFHAYNRLVEEGKAKPLMCLYDAREYVVSHRNGDLRLVCYTCSSSITPGINMISNIKAVVKEHHL